MFFTCQNKYFLSSFFPQIRLPDAGGAARGAETEGFGGQRAGYVGLTSIFSTAHSILSTSLTYDVKEVISFQYLYSVFWLYFAHYPYNPISTKIVTLRLSV